MSACTETLLYGDIYLNSGHSWGTSLLLSREDNEQRNAGYGQHHYAAALHH